jgi:hypothetical protein
VSVLRKDIYICIYVMEDVGDIFLFWVGREEGGMGMGEQRERAPFFLFHVDSGLQHMSHMDPPERERESSLLESDSQLNCLLVFF